VHQSHMDDDKLLNPALKVYQFEVGRALQQNATRLQELKQYANELDSVQQLLEELPNKLTQKISVPFGKHAFFTGELRHTNEITVNLGAKYYLECPAPQAKGVIQRRLKAVQQQVDAVQQQINSNRARLDLSVTELAHGPASGDTFEIRETYEESEALLNTARKVADATNTVEKSAANEDLDLLFARMDELARMEEEGAGDEDNSSGSPSGSMRQAEADMSARTAAPSDQEAWSAVSDAFESVSVQDALAASSSQGPGPHSTTSRSQQAQHTDTAASSSTKGIRKGFLMHSSTPGKQAVASSTAAGSTTERRSDGGSPHLSASQPGAAVTASSTSSAQAADHVPAHQEHAPSSSTGPRVKDMASSVFSGMVVERSVVEEEGHGATAGTAGVHGLHASAAPNVVAAAAAGRTSGDLAAAGEGRQDEGLAAAPPKKVSRFKQKMMGMA